MRYVCQMPFLHCLCSLYYILRIDICRCASTFEVPDFDWQILEMLVLKVHSDDFEPQMFILEGLFIYKLCSVGQ